MPYNLISRIKTDLNVVLNDINNKKKLIKLSKYKKGFSKFVEILDNQLSHDKIAQEVFKSSFETKKIISKKNLVYKNYYFLKNLFVKFFSQDNKEKFIFKNEISKNIKVLREVFKLNGNYKVTFVANSVYEIKKV